MSISHDVNWAKYTMVWIKPLELWKSDDPEAALGKMSQESQQMLVDTFYAAMHEGFKRVSAGK
jgi:hypothetical protein